jgi:hypothetical protein
MCFRGEEWLVFRQTSNGDVERPGGTLSEQERQRVALDWPTSIERCPWSSDQAMKSNMKVRRDYEKGR